jgi:hypothetical protein
LKKKEEEEEEEEDDETHDPKIKILTDIVPCPKA